MRATSSDSLDTVRELPWLVFEQLDQFRRWQGRMLEYVGLGPRPTPSHTVFAKPGLTLRRYGDNPTDGPVLLIVPAPIKNSSLWDLTPATSVVRRCLQNGLRIYLIHWEPPSLREQSFGLAEYADHLILDCLDAIRAETGEVTSLLVGHSLGGTLSAIFASLHPDRVQGLVLLGAPLHFGRRVGAFGPLAAAVPQTGLPTRGLGNVPGSLLSTVCYLAAPDAFDYARWADWCQSLTDISAMQTHLRVERWTLRETAMTRQLFDEVGELLYREDRFLRGRLMVGGRPATPQSVVAPVLSVVDPRCRIVPPEAVLPFHETVGSDDKTVIWYHGDKGVVLQHLGMLVGRHAHEQLWPKVIRWMHARWPTGVRPSGKHDPKFSGNEKLR